MIKCTLQYGDTLQIKLEFGNVVFVEERGKLKYPRKNFSDENLQQNQPTYDAESGNRVWATLLGCECPHHCAIPAPLNKQWFMSLQDLQSNNERVSECMNA